MIKNMIDLLKFRTQEVEIIEEYIKREAADKTKIRILEAGCGRKWLLNLHGIEYTLDGVDIDKNAFKIREKNVKDLDNVILGDLRFVDLKNNEYDVIYCSFVLEHIQNAKKVLDNFYKWLKTDGLLVLKIPDRNTVAGYITRITPFWFHIVYKKYVLGSRNAGKSGFGPYPTFYESIVPREGIHEYCKNTQFIIIAEYGHSFDLNKPGFGPMLTRLFIKTVSLISIGKLRGEYGAITFIIKKGCQHLDL